MAWIVGKKADLSTVEILNKTPEWTKAELKVVIPVNYGGVQGDYSYYQLSNNELKRVTDGDEYSTVWTSGDITSLSFTSEDSKRWVRFSSDVKKAMANGTDSIVLTAEIWLNDKSAIDTSYSGTILIDISIGRDIGILKLIFTSGVATKTLKSTNWGYWNIPSDPKQVLDESSVKIRVDKGYALSLKFITL